jgi:hypothetical protein
LKPVTHDASKPSWKHNSKHPLDVIDNELEFKMEAVFKSKQLRGQEWEYLVKWKGYYLIHASWVNESDMEHAQKIIKKFHNRPTKK